MMVRRETALPPTIGIWMVGLLTSVEEISDFIHQLVHMETMAFVSPTCGLYVYQNARV